MPSCSASKVTPWISILTPTPAASQCVLKDWELLKTEDAIVFSVKRYPRVRILSPLSALYGKVPKLCT